MTREAVDFRSLTASSLHITRPDRTDLVFPQRSDYIDYLRKKGVIASEEDLDSSPRVVLEMHRHWHSRGQHGCRFAMMLSSGPEGKGWGRIVIPGRDPSTWSGAVWDEIGDHIASAITNSHEQALSLLFPSITTDAAMVELIVQFNERLAWQLVLIDRIAGPDGAPLLRVGLRIPLPDGIHAWPIGFAPLPYLALTRRAPITEIAFMVKPKTYPLRPNITPDPVASHLADLQIAMPDDVWKKVWTSTQEAKAERLGDAANPAAKAKVTVVVPEKVWMARSSVILA